MKRPPSYLNFDLQLRPAPGGYHAQVLAAPGGEDGIDFQLPVDEKDLKIFLLTIGRPRAGATRGGGSPEAQATKEFGTRLFGAIFSGGVATCWASSYAQAQQQQCGLRLRLRIHDAPELNDIPWEYLYSSTARRFLPLSVETPLVRYLELPGHVAPLEVKGPLRILVMISSPTNYPALDVEQEWSRLKTALEPLERSGIVVVDRLPQARLSTLQDQLRKHEYHVLHFVGHGEFDKASQEGALVLCDGAGLAKVVSAERLATLTHNHKSLRLVVLNSCLGARTSSKDPLSGMAQTLVHQGIPAVVAMQFEISDDAAIAFAEEFYQAVGDGYPVDSALTEARVAIYSLDNEVEWGTPVLYLRSGDGNLFSILREPSTQPMVSVPAPTPPRPVPVAEPAQLRQAEAAPQAPSAGQSTGGRPTAGWLRWVAMGACALVSVVVFLECLDAAYYRDYSGAYVFGGLSAVALVPLFFRWRRVLYGMSVFYALATIGFVAVALGHVPLDKQWMVICLTGGSAINGIATFLTARALGRNRPGPA